MLKYISLAFLFAMPSLVFAENDNNTLDLSIPKNFDDDYIKYKKEHPNKTELKKQNKNKKVQLDIREFTDDERIFRSYRPHSTPSSKDDGAEIILQYNWK